jgi:predicted metal-dependent hydrolase
MYIKIDKIFRSKRRTLALVVTHDAQLIVHAPIAIADSAINDFISRKSDWIIKRQEKALSQKVIPKTFVDGEGFLYLGQSYRLRIIEKGDIALTDYLEFPRSFLPDANLYMIKWYKKRAFKKISERVRLYANSTGLKCPLPKITSAEKRWGSCGPRGTLSFSWRLVMAPLEIIDYVVVHELTHLLEKNHSRAFWRKVSLVMPGHESCKKWLRENEHLLSI